MNLSGLLQRYDHVVIDLDGTVWIGDEPTPGAREAVAALRQAGKGLAFVTNDPELPTEDYVRKLWRLGFQASLAEVVTVGGALQHFLATRGGGSAFVVGPAAIHRHVSDAGMRVVNRTDLAARADVVVVAGHLGLTFDELRVATQAALRGAMLVGAGRDATFPMPDGPWPGSGAILAAVETAAGRPADVVVGKPERGIFDAALDRLGAGRVLVVGDRLDADVAGAARMRLDAALVLSGVSTAEDVAAAGREVTAPVAVAPTLAALVLDGGAP